MAPHAPFPSHRRSGFTLIELSIVLVIIGLIVGGILVGQDLIHAATIRSQISQIEKYNTAVNSFQIKYDGLPGDLQASQAAQFGFGHRVGDSGRGDGNGLLEGGTTGSSNVCGEIEFFWLDLSNAGLISEQFQPDHWDGLPASGAITYCPGNVIPDYSANTILPHAKLYSHDYITGN